MRWRKAAMLKAAMLKAAMRKAAMLKAAMLKAAMRKAAMRKAAMRKAAMLKAYMSWIQVALPGGPCYQRVWEKKEGREGEEGGCRRPTILLG